MASSAEATERFTLLLLEDGEVLLDDVAVDYVFLPSQQFLSAADDASQGKAKPSSPERRLSWGHTHTFSIDTSSRNASNGSQDVTHVKGSGPDMLAHPMVARFIERATTRTTPGSVTGSTPWRRRGRLKLGSRSMFFDADDWAEPVVRIPIASVRDSMVAHSWDAQDATSANSKRSTASEASHASSDPRQQRHVGAQVDAEGQPAAAAHSARPPTGPGPSDASALSRTGRPLTPTPGTTFRWFPPSSSRASIGADDDDGSDVVVSERVSSMPDASQDGLIPLPKPQRRIRARSVDDLPGYADDAKAGPTNADDATRSLGRRRSGRRISLAIDSSFDGEDSGSSPSSQTAAGQGKRVLRVEASRVAFQREHGLDHPYVAADLDGTHIFIPVYTGVQKMHDLLVWLCSVETNLSLREQEQAIRKLVRRREARVPFDIAWLDDGLRESTILDEPCSVVSALSRAPGRMRLTSLNLYFMPIHGQSSGSMVRVALASLTSARRLRHGVRDCALELGYTVDSTGVVDAPAAQSNKTLMLTFSCREARERALKVVHGSTQQDLETFDALSVANARKQWQSGDMSTFRYLMHLNFASGRSFNDLSQYPVFPWVVSDYTSPELDLLNPTVFRDLSEPIGALNKDRLEVLRERFEEMPPNERFFYGTHYSTPAYVINYLVRATPASMLRLQNGRFDYPDRLFNSMADTWAGVNTSQTDVKELIPEFFAVEPSEVPSGLVSATATPGEFLLNFLGLDLGVRQDGARVADVDLPPWACGSSERFVTMHREALECVHVSCRIHEWIDLIFGYKARNAEASNLFYTDVAARNCEHRVAETEDDDDIELSQLETVFLEFGRTPEPLFAHPHPPRFGTLTSDLDGADDDGEFSFSTSSQSTAFDDGDHRGYHTPLQRMQRYSFERSERNSQVSQPSAWLSRLPSNATGMPKTRDAIPPNAVQGAKIIDVSVAFGQHGSFGSSGAVGDAFFATVWSDECLRIYSNAELRRTRQIDGLSAVGCGDSGRLFLGTRAGGVIVYQSGSGRSKVVSSNAHDAEVSHIAFSEPTQTLVTASMDASVKVWRVKSQMSRFPSLRRMYELDAEDDIVSLSTHAHGEEMFIAVLTAQERALAWRVDIGRRAEVDSRRGGTAPVFLDPVLDLQTQSDRVFSFAQSAAHMSSGRPSEQRLCWIGVHDSAPMLAAAIEAADGPGIVRIWSLDSPDMHVAEIVFPTGRVQALQSIPDSETVVVGGRSGFVAEYDRTGLCLHEARLGVSEDGYSGIESDTPITRVHVFSSYSTMIAQLGNRVLSW